MAEDWNAPEWANGAKEDKEKGGMVVNGGGAEDGESRMNGSTDSPKAASAEGSAEERWFKGPVK